ncbi:MAG TPA: glycosyltransferase [Verrucomicrobiae bacterium]|nr:glycosyltransferase [Verrucomicrobiae bacterium]
MDARALNVLHLNTERTWRGGEWQTLLLARALSEHGVRCSIGCRRGGALAERAAESRLPIVPLSGDTVRTFVELARAARDFDLVHCHTGRAHSLAAVTAPLHRKPVIVTRHIELRPPTTWFNRFKFGTAAAVVGVSEAVTAQLRSWGVPQAKLKMIPYGVPPLQTDARRAEELRQRLGITPSQKVVGTIGALVDHKDHEVLLRAAQRVARQRPNVRFVIVGEGERKPVLLKLRSDLGLDGVVEFAGYVTEAAECLPAFQVFALSSNMEGLPNVILEAFGAGVPVAATAASGTPQLVRDGETGLLVSVGDDAGLAGAVLRLLNEPALAQRVAAAARRYVETEFTLERMADRYRGLYEEVLGRG